MSKEIATLASLTSLPVSAAQTKLVKFGADTEWLKRLQLVTKGRYVDLQLITPGHYGVPKGEDEITDLGDVIDVLPLAVRDKALDTTESPPIAVYDPESDVFQDIEKRAGEKDSGCMFGPSFLLFERNSGAFYEFFCGNASARKVSGHFVPFLPVSEEAAEEFNCEAQGPQPMTMASKLVQRGKWTWHVPEVSKCSTPFNNLPAIERVVEEINKFNNPKEADTELVKEGERRR